jgi:hypothetical protein
MGFCNSTKAGTPQEQPKTTIKSSIPLNQQNPQIKMQENYLYLLGGGCIRGSPSMPMNRGLSMVVPRGFTR